MLPKIKKFMKKYKKQIIIGVVILVILIVFLILFKSLFYSDSEKATYGVRLMDIEQNELTDDDKKEFQSKISSLAGISKAEVNVKGRLIKVFATFEEGVSTDDIKARFNEMTGFLSEKVKGYYDVTFYAIQSQNGETKYPVIGYKHKSKTDISFDVV